MLKQAFLTIGAVSLSWAAPAVAQDQPIRFGTSHIIQSAVMGGPRTINVYVPPSCAEKSCPTMYVIDGGVDQDYLPMIGLSRLGGLTAMYPEMVTVGIETKDRANELTFRTDRKAYLKQYPTSGHADQFRHFIATEVKPYVAAHYKVTGKSLVIGESLAGLFIVDTFLHQPDLFTDYAAISPSMWWDEMALGRDASALLNNVSGPHQIYLTTANEGGMHQKGMDMLVAALKERTPTGVRWTYLPRPNEKHSTIYHSAALDALRWMYGQKN